MCPRLSNYLYIGSCTPTLFEHEEEKIRDGKVQPVGGLWMENDTDASKYGSLTLAMVTLSVSLSKKPSKKKNTNECLIL